MDDSLICVFVVLLILGAGTLWGNILTKRKRPTNTESKPQLKPQLKPQPQFTTELEALIAIEANTRQALELLRQQNKKSFWSMLFQFGMFSDD